MRINGQKTPGDDLYRHALNFCTEQPKKPWCQHGSGSRKFGDPCMGDGNILTAAQVDPPKIADAKAQEAAAEAFAEMTGIQNFQPSPPSVHVTPKRIRPCPCR